MSTVTMDTAEENRKRRMYKYSVHGFDSIECS